MRQDSLFGGGSRPYGSHQADGKTANRREERHRSSNFVSKRHVRTAMAQSADDEENKAEECHG